MLTIALVFVLTQSLTNIYAQKQLMQKLYHDNETVRGGGQKKIIITKKYDTTKAEEKEYFYKNKSGLFPRAGYAYISYYAQPNKVTLITGTRVTADVLLAGLDQLTLQRFTECYYWEVYDKFIYRNTRIRYVKVNERRSDGMHRVVLYAGGLNLNQWILRHCTASHLWKADERLPRWHAHPTRARLLGLSSRGWQVRAYNPSKYHVWLQTDGAPWLPAIYGVKQAVAKKRVVRKPVVTRKPVVIQKKK